MESRRHLSSDGDTRVKESEREGRMKEPPRGIREAGEARFHGTTRARGEAKRGERR